jgi:hypothetical protein
MGPHRSKKDPIDNWGLQRWGHTALGTDIAAGCEYPISNKEYPMSNEIVERPGTQAWGESGDVCGLGSVLGWKSRSVLLIDDERGIELAVAI